MYFAKLEVGDQELFWISLFHSKIHS